MVKNLIREDRSTKQNLRECAACLEASARRRFAYLRAAVWQECSGRTSQSWWPPRRSARASRASRNPTAPRAVLPRPAWRCSEKIEDLNVLQTNMFVLLNQQREQQVRAVPSSRAIPFAARSL